MMDSSPDIFHEWSIFMLPNVSGKKVITTSDANLEVKTENKAKDSPPRLRTKSIITSKARHAIQRQPVQRTISSPVKTSSSVNRAPSSASNSTVAISTPGSPSRLTDEKSTEIKTPTQKKDSKLRKNAYSRLQSLTTPIKSLQKKHIRSEEKDILKNPLQDVEWMMENPEHHEPDMNPALQRNATIVRKRPRDTEPELVVRPKKVQRTENTRLTTGVELPGPAIPETAYVQKVQQNSSDNSSAQAADLPENNPVGNSASVRGAQALQENPSEETVQINNNTAPAKTLTTETLGTNAGSEAAQYESWDAIFAMLEKVKQEL